LKLAIFDVDGTISDSHAMITASLGAAFEAEGLKAPDRARMLSGVGLSLMDFMRYLAPDESEARHARMTTAYKQNFWAFREAGEHPELLYDGAKPLLASLRQRGVVLGIATGKSIRGVAHLLDKHGMAGWFATIQTSDTNASKPDAAMGLAALAETGAAPRDTIMIGDTSFDMGMARNAGIGSIGVTWGNHCRAQLEQSGAQNIVSDFKELDAALEAMWEGTGA
jgi:phosphoglycolate phosphatase